MAPRKAADTPEGKATFIVSELTPTSSPARDKAGGVLHSGGATWLLGFRKKERSLEEVRADVAKLSETIATVTESIQAKQSAGFEVKTIEIGIAISAEGTIGVATAGVEASITVTLERKK